MKALLALAVLGLVPRLGYELEVARAVAFHFMAVGQLLLTYPSRHTWIRPLQNPLPACRRRRWHRHPSGGSITPVCRRALGKRSDSWRALGARLRRGGGRLGLGRGNIPIRVASWRSSDQRIVSAFAAAAWDARSNLTSATVPLPSRRLRITVPLCSSMSRFTIGKPSPVPVFLVV